MQAGDDAFQQLKRTIEGLAEAEVADLVAEARIEARAKVREILVDAMAQGLLDRAAYEVGHPAPGAASRRPVAKPALDSAPSPHVARAPVGAAPAISTAGHGEPGAGDAAARHDGDDLQIRAPQAPDSASGASGELGLYVYGVIGGDDLHDLDGMTGVDRCHPVLTVREGVLAAVVSRVPLDQFGEDSLRDSLSNVAWLEEKARAHEGVLDHVRRRTTVIPMRLCTIYRGEGSLREMLTRELAAVSEALERLSGKTEWGVKVFVNRDELERQVECERPAVAELAQQIDAAGAGEAYLLRRRLEEVRGEETERQLEEQCDAIHRQLSAAAVEAGLNPLQPPEVTHPAGEMVLNGVYLVQDTATGDFHAAVDALAQGRQAGGYELQLTGPWPPYNFVRGSIEAAW